MSKVEKLKFQNLKIKKKEKKKKKNAKISNLLFVYFVYGTSQNVQITHDFSHMMQYSVLIGRFVRFNAAIGLNGNI